MKASESSSTMVSFSEEVHQHHEAAASSSNFHQTRSQGCLSEGQTEELSGTASASLHPGALEDPVFFDEEGMTYLRHSKSWPQTGASSGSGAQSSGCDMCVSDCVCEGVSDKQPVVLAGKNPRSSSVDMIETMSSSSEEEIINYVTDYLNDLFPTEESVRKQAATAVVESNISESEIESNSSKTIQSEDKTEQLNNSNMVGGSQNLHGHAIINADDNISNNNETVDGKKECNTLSKLSSDKNDCDKHDNDFRDQLLNLKAAEVVNNCQDEATVVQSVETLASKARKAKRKPSAYQQSNDKER